MAVPICVAERLQDLLAEAADVERRRLVRTVFGAALAVATAAAAILLFFFVFAVDAAAASPCLAADLLDVDGDAIDAADDDADDAIIIDYDRDAWRRRSSSRWRPVLPPLDGI